MTSCCSHGIRTVLKSPQVNQSLLNITRSNRTLWSTSSTSYSVFLNASKSKPSKITVQQRTFYHNTIFTPVISSSTRYLSTGDLDNNKDSIQIYCGSLTTQIRTVKIFSLITSATGLAAQPMLIQKASEMNSLGIGIAIGGFFGFFTFITPFLLHWMTRKYVISLDYSPTNQEYTATTLTLLLGKKETQFTVDDLEVPEISGIFTTFIVKNKTSLFVDPSHFSHPEHYARLMGYDKPMDFKLETIAEREKSDSKS